MWESSTGSAEKEAPVWTGSPYPGLRPFDITEEAIFFGRGRETDALVGRLRDPDQRFLAVVGASGSGKSSLVRAGLLPRLRQGAIEGSQYWRVLTLTPGAAGGNPFLALAFELARELPPSTRKPAIKIAEELANEPQRVTEYAASLLAGSPAGAALVMFVDQMEELFRRQFPSDCLPRPSGACGRRSVAASVGHAAGGLSLPSRGRAHPPAAPPGTDGNLFARAPRSAGIG